MSDNIDDLNGWVEDISGFEPVFSYYMVCPDCGLSVVYEVGDPMCGMRLYCPECKVRMDEVECDGRSV